MWTNIYQESNRCNNIFEKIKRNIKRSMIMELIKTKKDVEQSLTNLLEKYSIPATGPFQLSGSFKPDVLDLQPGYEFLNVPLEKTQIPLLPWRMRRKFTELKKIVTDSIIEDPCLFRISSRGSSDNWTLSSLLYREMDLCEFIGNGNIVSIQANINDAEIANLIVKLDNEILCSIEVSTQLPDNSILQDRHEVIGRRGVASDMVVDTQVVQNSVYTFTEKGEFSYTDTDMELFGLREIEIDQVRAAFNVLKDSALIMEWQQQHKHLANLLKTVFESDKNRKKINLKNESIYTHETN
jgi:hypothetical protein